MKNKITIIMILMSISFGYSQVLVPENTGYGYDNLTTVQLNALTKKKVGDIYYNADLGYHVKWNGVIFESLASGISGIDPADQDKLNNISITQPVNLDTVESLANSALQTETDPTTTPANIKAKLESLTGTNRLDAFAIKNLSAQETDPNLTKSNVEGLGISYTSLSDVPSVSPPLTFGPGFTRTGDNIVLDNPFTTANETTLNSALQSETDPLYSAWDKDYNDLINRPVNLVTYDPLTAQDVQISVLGGSDSESYILEFDPDGYDYSGEPSGTGTVSQTIIDGDTNAVSGNAVFDGLATKLQAGSNDLGSSNFYVNSDGILALANSNTQSTVFVNPYGSGLIAGNSDDSEIMKLTLSPSSITADLSNSQITSTGAESLITKGYADATYAAIGSGGSGDNLGDHLATEDIQMDGNWIKDAGNVVSQYAELSIADITGLNVIDFANISADASFSKLFRLTPRLTSADGGVPAEGQIYWNSTENRPKAYDGTSHKSFLLDGDERTSGTTANRPSSPATGKFYLDTTLNLPIWYNGTNWIDATGTTR
ncbi:virion structural protein [Cellulophaga phage phi46:3]|uniref:Structural protein n=1 Tax=Cellulophaga phage phi46:3 TaxID=1327985 RepID=S0A3M0_9CAUD|nr:virion structural protein [Cellulophaga phage phi46:3]AGO48823.1 structural protein [Cellulophaga phage phi46:3]